MTKPAAESAAASMYYIDIFRELGVSIVVRL